MSFLTSGLRHLPDDKRVPDVRVRHPLLRLVHHQPHPLQPHVSQIQTGRFPKREIGRDGEVTFEKELSSSYF